MNTLNLKWTISKGRDTYGYNVVTLTDTETSFKYQTNGGGYDMVGTVFGSWLANKYQEELLEIAEQANATYTSADGYKVRYEIPGDFRSRHLGFYGMTYYPEKKMISLDGACGLNEMLKISSAIGLDVKEIYTKRLVAFEITEKAKVN